jgi:hypothetical protein
VESLDPQHLDSGAAYHFVINNGLAPGTADGQIAPTPRWIDQQDGPRTRSAGPSEFNAEGIDICLIGDFDRDLPTARQMASLEILVNLLRDRYNIPLEMIVSHSQLRSATHCPGVLFPMEDFVMNLCQAARVKRMRLAPADAP